MKYPIVLCLCLIVNVTHADLFRRRHDPDHVVAQAQAGKVARPINVESLQSVVKYANDHGKKIAVAGTQYSQGGQTQFPGAIQVDMTALNKIINIDVVNKQITVEAGITWADILRAIDPLGLSILAMQSYSSFSVGGSIGVNAHGQNIHDGQVMNTIISLDVVKADGSLVTIHPARHSRLFSCVVGGYGLCGIVARVTLQLTDNNMVEKQYDIMPTSAYASYFKTKILQNPAVQLHSARLSVDPGALFNKLIAITYYYVNGNRTLEALQDEKDSLKGLRDQWLFGLMRKYNWAKHYRFIAETLIFEKPEIISRNNAMNWTLSMLEYRSMMYKDILQEYFVPVDRLGEFLVRARDILQKNKVNILNATIRYVPEDGITLMSYAPEPRFSVVLYMNVGKKPADERHTLSWTQKLIEAAFSVDGTYYLPYGLYATREQMHKGYPGFEELLELKRKRFDPHEIFVNQLYATYA